MYISAPRKKVAYTKSRVENKIEEKKRKKNKYKYNMVL